MATDKIIINLEFKAYIKDLDWEVPVQRICFDVGTVEVDLSLGMGDYSEYNFEDVILKQLVNDKWEEVTYAKWLQSDC